VKNEQQAQTQPTYTGPEGLWDCGTRPRPLSPTVKKLGIKCILVPPTFVTVPFSCSGLTRNGGQLMYLDPHRKLQCENCQKLAGGVSSEARI